MSNQKKKFNSSVKKADFFIEFREFNNIKSEDEKYKKGMDIIKNITNFKITSQENELFYYSGLAELYYYISKIKSKKYKLSNGFIFEVEAILDEKNKQYLDEVIEYKKISFDNYKKSLNAELIKRCSERLKELNKTQNQFQIERNIEGLCYRNREGLRILSQDLSNLYYIINDEDAFVFYGRYAIEYGSLEVTSLFLKYYCDKLDYDNAYTYYNLMSKFNPKDYGEHNRNVYLKSRSYSIFYKFLYNLGMYEESLSVAKECKRYLIHLELNMNQYEVLKNINEHIKKCESKIDELKEVKCTEDILLNYFDKEILNLMSDDNKIYILTSLKIYEYMKTLEITMDYSATLMPILKAVENIMYEIIAKKYRGFILEKKELEKRYIKAFLDKDDKFIMKMDRLEYGKALSLIGCKNNYKSLEDTEIIPNNYFLEFCQKNNVTNARQVVIEIYKELDRLKEKRNLVAHKNRIDEECVKECYDILLENIKFINYLYTNFKFVFENQKSETKI